MPNWCEGYLKIRGKQENIIKFIKREVVNTKFDYETRETYHMPIEIKPTEVGNIFISKIGTDFYLKNTRRFYIKTSEIDFYSSDNYYEINYLTLHIEQAWYIDIQDLLVEHSKKYDLDFNIFASEQGGMFEQYITVVAGNLIRYEEKTYKDFRFEAINPTLGG